MSHAPSNKYAMTLGDLEKGVHVPLDEQVSEQAEPPPEAPISEQELDRLRLLGPTGAGRLRH